MGEPDGHEGEQDGGADEVGAHHQAALLHPVGPVAGEERDGEAGGGLEGGEIARAAAEQADRDPGDDHGEKLVADGRGGEAGPQQRDGAVAQRGEKGGPAGRHPDFTRLLGVRPASSASSPSSAMKPMASRVVAVALPRWGSSTAFSAAR